MKIVIIHAFGHTDGYSEFVEGYAETADLAEAAAKARHGSYGRYCGEQPAIPAEDGRFYILKSHEPVALEGTPQMLEEIRKTALAKLTKEERRLLGL